VDLAGADCGRIGLCGLCGPLCTQVAGCQDVPPEECMQACTDRVDVQRFQCIEQAGGDCDQIGQCAPCGADCPRGCGEVCDEVSACLGAPVDDCLEACEMGEDPELYDCYTNAGGECGEVEACQPCGGAECPELDCSALCDAFRACVAGPPARCQIGCEDPDNAAAFECLEAAGRDCAAIERCAIP